MTINALHHQSNRNLAQLRSLPLSKVKGLLDVDGVFSAPHRGTALPEQLIVDQYVAATRRGLEASLATGRPGIWITQPTGVLGLATAAFAEVQTAAKAFDKLVHFAENGAVKVKRERDGFSEMVVDPKYKFPRRFETVARNIAYDLGIDNFAAFDDAKACVISLFVNKEGFGQMEFEPYKARIAASFENFIAVNQMPWTVSQTAIAVDAYHKEVTKELAVKGFLSELVIPGNQPDLAVISVGDSPSDFALFTGLKKAREEGKLPPVTKLYFVFTGTLEGLNALQLKYGSMDSSGEFIFAGTIKSADRVEVYSDATQVFFDELLR